MCDVPECRSEKTCDPCLVEGKEEEAKHFCVHCLEYFCLTCAQYHRKYKQSRAHVILDDLPEDTSIYERVLKFSNCLFHPEIEIDRFCKQHDKMFCRSCSDIHASCEHVVNIEECQKGNIDDIPDKLTALKSMYSTQKKELERQLEELRVNSLEVKNNIREYVQQIREVADKVEQSLNEHHQSLVSPSYAIIKQGIENVEEKEVKLNECKIFHDIMPNISSTKDQYVLVCKLNQLINDSALQPDRASLYARLISPSHTKELIAELFKCEVKLLSNEELTQEKSSDEDTCPADNNNVLFNADGMMTDKRENNDVLENRTATYREDESTATLKEGESTAKLREGESTATLREGESTVTFREGESTATFREGESTATCREVEEQSICLQNDGPVKDLDNQLNVNDDSPFLKMILGPKDKIFNIRRTDIAERGVCNIVQLDVLSDGRVILIDNGLIVLKLFSPEFTFISCMVLSHTPLDMCILEEKGDKTFTVAVCFERRNYISLINHLSDFNITKNIQCKRKGNIISLALFAQDILVLAYEKTEGKKDYQIHVIQRTSGRVRFALNVPELIFFKDGKKTCMHDLLIIRACDLAKRIILAADNAVYVFIIHEGNSVKQRFQTPVQCDWFCHRSVNINVASITDVKMDIHGNIYICDPASGLHQVSGKSSTDHRILLPKAERISSIVIDMPRRRILICHANSSFTSMYRI